MTKEYLEGRTAAQGTSPIGKNPYTYGTVQHDDWNRGHRTWNGHN